MSVLTTDRVSVRGPAHFIQNDTRTQVVWFTVNRYRDGIDLAGLSWSIHILNAAGIPDVAVPFEQPDVRGDKIIIGWLVRGTATAAAGDLTFNLRGVGEDENGNALRWSGGDEKRPVYTAQESEPSDEQEAALSELDALIEYVGNQLPGVISAGKEAREAANAANASAEAASNAGAAAASAANAATEATANAKNLPYIGENGNWYLWDTKTGAYVDSGKPSRGEGSEGGGGITEETDPTVPNWAKSPNKPSYTAAEVGALPATYVPPNQTAAQVGADPAGTASKAVSTHNTSGAAHNDIRLELSALAARINAALNSDDVNLDQMAEIVAYIKSNKSLIDAITTGKVSVGDIVNNLTTNAANKPLSAAQGVTLKALIDAITVPTKLSELSGDASHRLVTDTEKSGWSAKLDSAALPEAVNTALAQAKASGEFDGATGPQGPKGDTGATGPAGKDGSAGAAGADGISPTVSVSKSGKVTTITITDKNGTKTVDVMDGAKGDPGSDASVTEASIKTALGYTPADSAAVKQITDYVHITPGEDGEKAENIRDDANVAWTDGLYVNYQTGETSTYDSYTGSEHYFILPEGGRVFARFKNNILYYPTVAFYNESRAFLGGEYPVLSSTGEREEYNGMYGVFYTIPDGAKYFRASFGSVAKDKLEIYLIYPTKVGGSVSIPDLDIPKSAIDGKTVVCFGDSLFGMYRGEDSAPAFIAKETGATVYNVGFGGCRMSVHPTSGYAAFSMWALAKAIAENNWSTQDAQASGGSAYFPEQLALLKSIDFSKVDIAVIHYGTNDFGAGTAVQIDNASDHDDYNTLCGALRYSIEKLLGAFPKLRIYISLPVYRFWVSNGVNTYAETYLNKGGKILPEFVEALRNVAAEYNLPVIDGYYGLGINKANASTYLEDGTHHNATGRERFGKYIGANLISQQTGAKSGADLTAVQALIDNSIGAAIGGAY